MSAIDELLVWADKRPGGDLRWELERLRYYKATLFAQCPHQAGALVQVRDGITIPEGWGDLRTWAKAGEPAEVLHIDHNKGRFHLALKWLYQSHVDSDGIRRQSEPYIYNLPAEWFAPLAADAVPKAPWDGCSCFHGCAGQNGQHYDWHVHVPGGCALHPNVRVRPEISR